MLTRILSTGFGSWLWEQIIALPQIQALMAKVPDMTTESFRGTFDPEIQIEVNNQENKISEIKITGWKMIVTLGEQAKLALDGIDFEQAQQICAQMVENSTLPLTSFFPPENTKIGNCYYMSTEKLL